MEHNLKIEIRGENMNLKQISPLKIKKMKLVSNYQAILTGKYQTIRKKMKLRSYHCSSTAIRQPFDLADLENCQVLLLDHCDQVQVDNLVNCRVFIGENYMHNTRFHRTDESLRSIV